MDKRLLELTEGLNQWETKPLLIFLVYSLRRWPHGLRKQLVINDAFGASSSHVATFPIMSITA